MMGVIPIGSRLTWGRKFVEERMSRGDWALVYSGGTIVISGAMLEKTMPMLISLVSKGNLARKVITMLVLNNIFGSVRASMTLTWKSSP